MKDHILLSGCTGLLGRYLLRDMLLANVPLAVLIRPGRNGSPEDRLTELMDDWQAMLGRSLARPKCLAGDVTLPGLGLSTGDRSWVRHNCRSMLHSAASLTFVGKDRRRDPWFTNVGGTVNVLALCQDEHVDELHYVSTAYVCGTRPGKVLESELDVGQQFRNDYEESKVQCEKLVRQSGLKSITVFRPAVIVGDSQTGYTSSYHGPYRYFQFAWLLAEQAEREPNGRWELPVRLQLTGQERHNLVPVDWVSAVIAEIAQRPALHGATYHLGPRQAVLAADIEDVLGDYFGYYGVTFAGPHGAAAGNASEFEKFFYQYIGVHHDYLRSEPDFDCTNTLRAVPQLPCPILGAADLRRFIDFGVRDMWGKSKTRPLSMNRA